MLVFEKSRAGRGMSMLPACDVEIKKPGEKDARQKELHLPQMSENDLSRHYTELAKKSHGVNDGFYPLGSCTMKYNPKINEDMAALPGFTQYPSAAARTFCTGMPGSSEKIRRIPVRDHRNGRYDIPACSRSSRRVYRSDAH